MAADAAFRGFNEVDRALATFPAKTAKELQRLLVVQLIEVKKRIAQTSTMRPGAKRALRARDGIVKIIPDVRVHPRSLKDVHAELFTIWRGGGKQQLSKKESASRVIEEDIGDKVYTPKRKRGLLIPGDALRTKTGLIKKKGGKKIDPAEIPGATFIRTKRGVLLVREVATKRGKRRRSEVLAILAQKARPTARLTFFDSWDDLKSKRTRDFGRMLSKLIKKF